MNTNLIPSFIIISKQMRLIVLISCMNQPDFSIVQRSNIQTDVVVVNQCDTNDFYEYDFTNIYGQYCHVKFICTTERGLSRSRNMAIANAEGADICLICDDDEYLVNNYEDIILKAYQKAQDGTALIAFAFSRKDKVMPTEEHMLGIKEICKTSSVEITFKRRIIVENNIVFDIKMGSGSGNGAGEENKFMMDIRRAGYKMKYYPEYIGQLLSYESRWFNGWSELYFRNNGWASRRIFGFFVGYFFAIFQTLHHYDRYRKHLSFIKAFINTNIGFFENR